MKQPITDVVCTLHTASEAPKISKSKIRTVTGLVSNQVLRYEGTTGEFVDVFASGGNNGPKSIKFGPEEDFYLLDQGYGEVLRYDGTTGAFDRVFASISGTPRSMEFGPDGNLYAVPTSGH